MQDGVKKNIKKVLEDAEAGVAKVLIRWKYRKNDTPVPDDVKLEEESRRVAERAHEVVTKRGKIVWNELKQVYGNINERKGEEKK